MKADNDFGAARAGKVWQAPLYYVSPSQASFLLPHGVSAGAASVKVMRGGATVLTGSLTVAAVRRGIVRVLPSVSFSFLDDQAAWEAF